MKPTLQDLAKMSPVSAAALYFKGTPETALFMAVLACLCFGNSVMEPGLCDSSPCQNGGVCNQVLTTYYCDCPDSYDGRDCQVKLTYPKHLSCKSSPCRNGGTCHQLSHAYYCDCPSSYRGLNCESKIEPREHCQSSPCKNGGVCYDLFFTYYCECPRHYHGHDCQTRQVFQRHSCDSSPCRNDGTCQELDFTYRCVCREGFLGFNCEVENVLADYCSSFPCQNGGVCHNTDLFRYICVCAKDYRGRNCELKKYSTSLPYIKHHGDAVGLYPLEDTRAVSAVATAGIYAGVALGCLGVALTVFLFWRRKCVMLAMCYEPSDEAGASDHPASAATQPPEYSSLLLRAEGGADVTRQGNAVAAWSIVSRDRPPSYRTATQQQVLHVRQGGVARPPRQMPCGGGRMWTAVTFANCAAEAREEQDGSSSCDAPRAEEVASTQPEPGGLAVQDDIEDSEPPPSYEEAVRDSSACVVVTSR